MTRSIRKMRAFVVAAVVVSAITAGLGAVVAQEPAVNHPAEIVKGSCANLPSAPAYPLANVVERNGGTPMASPAAGASGAIPAWISVSDVDVTLTDLLAAPAAIDIRESAEERNDVVACGDIGGQPVNDQLAIGLRGRGSYGYSGIALLQANGARTTVTIYLAEGLAPAQATPAAASANTIAVTLTDMKIASPQTTFVVGRPYTLVVTNKGAAVHELVIEKRGVVDQPLEQGDQEAEASNIAPGQTKTLVWTFAAPGSYQFACHIPGHYEAGMVLDIDVTAS